MHQTTSSSLNTSAISFGFDDRDTWRFVSIYRYFGPDFNCAYAVSSSELTVYILTLLLDLATLFYRIFVQHGIGDRKAVRPFVRLSDERVNCDNKKEIYATFLNHIKDRCI